MKLSYPKTKHIRLAIDKAKLKGALINLRYCIQSEAKIGLKNNKQYWAGIRWRLSYLNNADDEVIGYLGENRVWVFEVGNKDEDLPVLQKFAYDAYLDVDVYINAELKGVIRSPALPYPDIQKLGSKLSDCLGRLGAYQ
jgi:hypothetical protein